MKFFNFPITNLLILNLLIFTFGFVNLNSQNHTIFLYGSIDGEYNKKDMQFLYTSIAQEIIENGGTTEFWPKRETSFRKRNRFCNHRKMSRAYNLLITNVYYRQLKEQIIENYEETGEQINIVAIGDGITVLKYFLKEFHEIKCNCINKAIIIENSERISQQNRMYMNSLENVRYGRSIRRYITVEDIIRVKNIQRIMNLDETSLIHSEFADDERTPTDVSTPNVYATDLSDTDLPDTDLSDTDLSNKVVVVDAQEYIELLKQQEEGCCCKFFTGDRIKALTGLAVVILPILLAA